MNLSASASARSGAGSRRARAVRRLVRGQEGACGCLAGSEALVGEPASVDGQCDAVHVGGLAAREVDRNVGDVRATPARPCGRYHRLRPRPLTPVLVRPTRARAPVAPGLRGAEDHADRRHPRGGGARHRDAARAGERLRGRADRVPGCESRSGSSRPCDHGTRHFCLFVSGIDALYEELRSRCVSFRSDGPVREAERLLQGSRRLDAHRRPLARHPRLQRHRGRRDPACVRRGPYQSYPAPSPEAERKVGFVAALREALDLELEPDPSVFVMGEEIGNVGGIFRATDGRAAVLGLRRRRLRPDHESGCEAPLHDGQDREQSRS